MSTKRSVVFLQRSNYSVNNFMECKFLQNGITIKYDQIIRPCCEWRASAEYDNANHITQVDLVHWHDSKDIVRAREQLAQGKWPQECGSCERIEQQGRGDSMRLNSLSSYSKYSDSDITLEIRPGSVCNFACQTCWPAASSRVAEYQVRAGMVVRDSIDSNSFTDFDQLLPIAGRIKNVVLLGGEPFYDPSCKKFLTWASKNLSAGILMFTNGSMINWEFLNNYPGNITLVFSLDAAGTPAEYIRMGTEWATVLDNYTRANKLYNVSVRVNITLSVYNYLYLESLFDILCSNWPGVVTFGAPWQSYLTSAAVPQDSRHTMISSLTRVKEKISATKIESGQWHNAVNAIQSIIDALNTVKFDEQAHGQLLDYIARLDSVKHIKLVDYCPELAAALA